MYSRGLPQLPCLSVFPRKPVIGIAGGIGGGKSFVAKLFGELGCMVIDSDAQVRDAYNDSPVQDTIRQWWGDGVFRADGTINRSAIAARVFASPAERERLERLLHPWVERARNRVMQQAEDDPQVLAFVWDTPLLFEKGLHRQCDAVVFVASDEAVRLRRLKASRGWDEAELRRREKSQWPLDKKREISDYVVVNTADANERPAETRIAGNHDQALRGQVREILSRVLSNRRQTFTDGR